MSNRFLAVVASLFLAASGFAEVRWGQVEIAFFRVRNEAGQMVDLPTKGIVLPVRMERINAHPVGQGGPASFSSFFEEPLATKVYENHRGTNNFYDPGGPSALDDITILPSGNGQWWSDLTLGVATSIGNPSVKIMNRQLGWTTFTAGRGAGVSAFSNLVFDVGWVFQPGQFPVGNWEYTIPISQYWSQIPPSNMPRVPQDLIYFAQEWRAYNIFGEGAFLTNQFSPIFSGGGPPTVGSSEDVYWNDWDPQPDGIFDETEQDYFGGSPTEANFLMVLNTQQSGVQETVRPTSVTLFRGVANGGNVGSLHFVDQNYFKAKKGVTLNQSEAPIQMICEGFASTGNLTAMVADVMSKVNTTGLTQIIEMYNFVSNQWVLVDQRAATTTDSRLTVGAPGNAAQYVDTANGNIVRMKISYKVTGPTTQTNWNCSVDLQNWITTHP
ncbi:MAG: hypothetical protein JSS66_01760 [Armatimonadetes bacterium]|nr:hypothetical protein [Armatimonadota bacterium]